jgi:hypothetical protein
VNTDRHAAFEYRKRNRTSKTLRARGKMLCCATAGKFAAADERGFMDCWVVRAILRAAAAMAAIALGAVLGSASAQTLTDPNPPAKWSPPRATAKSRPASPQKPCATYGAGFINVPGTDTCVKVGGWVTMEGSVSH